MLDGLFGFEKFASNYSRGGSEQAVVEKERRSTAFTENVLILRYGQEEEILDLEFFLVVSVEHCCLWSGDVPFIFWMLRMEHMYQMARHDQLIVPVLLVDFWVGF